MALTSPRPELFVPVVPTAPPRRLPYQPALDGLRGVAVAAVVLYHGDFRIGDLHLARGGYLGVDAFFVLSGYLITTLLLTEWQATGAIALRQFWVHRARRLLPALLLVLAGVCAFAVWVAKPDVLDQLRADGVSTLFYVMNWRLIASSQSYFDQFFASPLRHMWSLAIEEQYYLIWPLLTYLVMRWRRSPRAMLVLCVALTLVSSAAMLLLYDADADPSRVYYGTDTRAQSLLVGSALAAAIASGLRFDSVRARRGVLASAIAAAAVLGYCWVRLSATSPWLYRGGFLALAVGVALVLVACTQVGSNPVRSVLSLEPLRRLGLISYGVYVYHWPVFIWLNPERTGITSATALLAVRILVTLAIATASFLLVERPIREGRLRRIRAAPALLPAAIGVVLVLILASTSGAQRTTPLAGDLDASKRPPPTVSEPATGPADTKVLLVGDSVAYTLGVGFEGSVSTDNHVAVWNQAVLFCELISAKRRENGEVKPASDTCTNWEGDWRNDVSVFDPDVTVLMLGAWEIFDREIDGEWIEFGTPAFDALLYPRMQRAVDALSSGGAPVVVLTTPRFIREDSSTQEWTQNDVGRTDHFNELVRRLAIENPERVILVDLAGFLCPGNQCHETIDGVEMRPDGLHFKESDARVVAAWLAPQFRQIALGTYTPAPVMTTPGTVPPEPEPTPGSAVPARRSRSEAAPGTSATPPPDTSASTALPPPPPTPKTTTTTTTPTTTTSSSSTTTTTSTSTTSTTTTTTTTP